MSEQEGRAVAPGVAEEPVESPSEKLEDGKPVGSTVPGAQNPESDEVKKEINPNTE